MLKALSKWFGESQMTIPEDQILQCRHESHMYSCDLVEELKVKQAERKRVYCEIKDIPAVEEMNLPGIGRCVDVLKELVGHHSFRYLLNRDYMNTHGREAVISIMNSIVIRLAAADVDQVCSDLRKVRERSDLIDSKNKRLTQLDVEIHKLKTELGID